MALQKGLAAVKQTLEKTEQKPKQQKFETTNWIGWKAGETKVLRFLTDSEDIIIVTVHENVDTFDGRKRTFACRQEFGADCELCNVNAYKRSIGYGVAVLRQEVYEEVDGVRKLTGYKDVVETYEVEENGQTVTKKKPYVGIVSQALRNFWSGINLIHEKYGSLKDRDIEIVRQGAGTDTQYMPFALDKKEIANIDSRYAPFLPNIESFLTRIGSQEYYDAQLRGIKPEQPKATTSTTEEESWDDEYEEESSLLEEETEADRLRKKLAAN